MERRRSEGKGREGGRLGEEEERDLKGRK